MSPRGRKFSESSSDISSRPRWEFSSCVIKNENISYSFPISQHKNPLYLCPFFLYFSLSLFPLSLLVSFFLFFFSVSFFSHYFTVPFLFVSFSLYFSLCLFFSIASLFLFLLFLHFPIPFNSLVSLFPIFSFPLQRNPAIRHQPIRELRL